MTTCLRSRRLELGLKQTQVAEAIGYNKASYANIESGKRTPSLNIARRIAEFLNSTVDELFVSPRRQPGDTIAQGECINQHQPAQDSITKARAVDSATKGFRVDTDLILDIAADGRIDDPARREEAQELHGALGRVLYPAT